MDTLMGVVAMTVEDCAILLTKTTLAERISYHLAHSVDVAKMEMWQYDRRRWDAPKASAEYDLFIKEGYGP